MNQFAALPLPPVAPPLSILLNVGTFWAYLLLAFCVGALTVSVGVWYFVNKPKISLPKHLNPGLLAIALVGLFLFSATGVTHAQTPVPLDIPTSEIFSETNNWMATFAPIAAIGIGIAVAMAILGYIGKMIIGAFKG